MLSGRFDFATEEASVTPFAFPRGGHLRRAGAG